MEEWMRGLPRCRVTRGRWEGEFARFQPSVDEGWVYLWLEQGHPYFSASRPDRPGSALHWAEDMIEPVTEVP